MAQFPLLAHCASRSHTPGPKRAYRQPPTTPTSTATAAPRRTQDLNCMTLSLVVGSGRALRRGMRPGQLGEEGTVPRRRRGKLTRRRKSTRAAAAADVTAVLGAIAALGGMASASDGPHRPRVLPRAPVAIEPALLSARAAAQT